MPIELTAFLAIVTIPLWIWSIKDVVSTNFTRNHYRTIWLMIVLFFPLLGSICYFLLKSQFEGPRRTFNPKFIH
ncbi:MAG: phospholipase [Flammeovirgaceae bacterium]|nr:phospholipase [Flammeovirgaceae bacterium]MBE61962.1 phospholipase [Flammeovirgaceae bacterium]HCX23559.1 phospholipase [Cytophagales bacterium]